jgi:competence protein ComEC
MNRPVLSLWLAPVVVGATLLLQRSPTLPAGAWLLGAALAAAALALAGAGAMRRAPAAAGWLMLGAAGCACWAWAGMRAQERLAERLPASLEGIEIGVRGVIDELPVPLRQGQRFGFRVEGCARVADVSVPAATSPPVADEPSGPQADGAPAAGAQAGGAQAGGSQAGGSQAGAAPAAGAPAPPGPGQARFPGGPGPLEVAEAEAAMLEPPPRAAASCALPPRLQLGWQAGLRGPAREAVPTLRPGQRWILVVRLKRPHATVNPGAFDRELRWMEEGIGAVGTVRRGRLLEESAGGPAVALERLRLALRDAVFDASGRDRAREAGVLAALAIGDQTAIDPALWTVFNQTGVGHLMSISGLHITMLAGLGGSVAGWCWRRRWAGRMGLACRVPAQRVRLGVAVSVAFGYALLAGWGIPAQRTCFMLAMAALLMGTGRGASIAAAVGAAAAAIVVLDPWAPLSAGFWLSFGAVVAIVWVCTGSRFGQGRLAEFATGAVRTQWAATVALLPLGAWFFGSVSVVGPLANAVAIPLVSAVVTPLALAGAALALASTDLAGWLLAPAAWLMGVLLALLQWLAALPGASLPVPRPGAAVLAATLAGCAMLLAPAGVPRRALGGLALLPLAAAPLQRPAAGELWMTALDVGQGMSVVIQVADRTLVYDAGPTTGPHTDAGSRVVVPWLRNQGIGRLDAVVVSHLDDDHSGGALSVLQAAPPDWLASSLPDDHRIVLAAGRALRCRRGERWAWGEAHFEWLHPADPPEPARGSPTNAVSCVLRIVHPGGTVLLAGDIEAPQERRLVGLYGADGLAADVLLVPHHGSATSSTEAFLDAVSPRWAVFQVAYRSRFRHPHPRVLERYERRGIGILRSDADGAVQLRLSAGSPPGIVRSRAEPMRYWRVRVEPP